MKNYERENEAVLKIPYRNRPTADKGTNPFLTLPHASSWEERSIFLLRTGKRGLLSEPAWQLQGF